MRWDRLGYLSLVLLFLICAVSALVPDNATLTSSKPDGWFVANGMDSGQFTAKIYNNTTPLTGYHVVFSLNTTLLGTLSATDVLAQVGIAQTTFSTLKKSGDLMVNASIMYRINDSDINEPFKYKNLTLFQQVDHDTPWRIDIYNFTNEMTVATVNPIQLGFVDQWGNPVDSRRIPENVELTISQPAPQDGGFEEDSSWVTDITDVTDRNGTILVNLKANTKPGWLYINVHPTMQTKDGLQAIPDKALWIEGIPGIPYTIQSLIEPTNHQQYADGISTFHITYLVKDKFGNNVQNRSLTIHTDLPGEQDQVVGTNANGQAMLLYGPKTSIGMIWVNATAYDNSSVQAHDQVWFVSQNANDIQLSANPGVMPSIDANPGFSAQIIAKVIDVMGNPVSNITVGFAIDNSTIRSDKPNDTVTSGPYLSQSTGITDQNGFSIINFTPGGFTTNISDPHYDNMATGRCNVTATWNGTTRSVPLIWKNYPYLSVNTYTSKSQVQVNDTVDVTVMLQGDGWALQPKPADIVLVTDLAGGIGSGQLLGYTKNADIAFVNNASDATYIGLVSFGYNNPGPYNQDALNMFNAQGGVPANTTLFNPYGNVWDYCLVNPTLWDQSTAQRPDSILILGTPHYTGNWNSKTGYSYFNSYSDATIDNDIVPTSGRAGLITTINKYYGKGGTDYAAGINAAIQEFQKNQNPGHLRAIIIMGDGIPMMAPIAPGSVKSYWPSDWYPRSNLGWEDESDTAINAAVDASQRAQALGITVYAAGFPLNNQVDNDTFLKIVSSPDSYYYTPDPSKLTDLLLTIEGRIQKQAGVNTSMGLNYGTIEINSVPVTNGGNSSVFNYIYSNGNSTFVNSYYLNGSIPDHAPAYPYSSDQTLSWNSTKILPFDVGTVYLNQVWVGKYRLQVLQEGNINIFGPGSTVTFNNGTASLTLPKTFITGIASFNNTNVTTNTLRYTEIVQDTGSGDSRSQLYISFKINSTYTGSQDVTENYYIITYDQKKYLVGTSILTPYQANHERTFTMAIADLPLGWQSFLPVQSTMDAPGPERPLNPPPIIPPPTSNRSYYINLQ